MSDLNVGTIQSICSVFDGLLTGAGELVEILNDKPGTQVKSALARFEEKTGRSLADFIPLMTVAVQTLHSIDINQAPSAVASGNASEGAVIAVPCVEIGELIPKENIDPRYKIGHISVSVRVPIQQKGEETIEEALARASYLANYRWFLELNKKLNGMRIMGESGFGFWYQEMAKRYPMDQVPENEEL